MPRKVLLEEECDYSINTCVNLGKRIKDVPQGWALNLMDIRDFIPVLRYELEGYLQIRGIITPCRIKINPRLFYNGSPLRDHLRRLKAIDENVKIPIEIKFNKKKLDKAHDEFEFTDEDYIETKLTVGKPKKGNSGGWGLKKDVVYKIMPLDAYNFMFPVYIDGIPAETRLNMQTRLFYTNKELRQELNRLSKIDPKQKVEAKIILNEEYLEFIKSFRNTHLSDRKCTGCGKPIDKDSKNNKCFDCLDKELTVLKLKNLLDFFNPSEIIYEEDLLRLGFTKGKSRIIFSKLEKYGLVSKNWDGSFQLKEDSVLNNFIKKWG